MPQSHRASATLRFNNNGESYKGKVTTLKKLTITKKEPYNKALSKNGASGNNWLQPLANIIIRELETMSIADMLCYA